MEFLPKQFMLFVTFDCAHTLARLCSCSVMSRNSISISDLVSPNNLKRLYWLDENVYCRQVSIGDISVCRREDDNYVNGTKLLNACKMSRGKRDGILKLEKDRRVVRAGPMNFKGVWIPCERAKMLVENTALFPEVAHLFDATINHDNNDEVDVVKSKRNKINHPHFISSTVIQPVTCMTVRL